METHPLYSRFAAALVPSAASGTFTTSASLCAPAFAVYLDLILGKEFAAVHPAHATRTDRIVLITQRDPKGNEEIVVPMTEQESWSVKSLDAMFAALHDIRPALESLVLAILASDSTVVYYRIHQGLVPPVEEKED
ncbi:hypothetical protein HDU86_005877 [Geranomyces michiganensis]|nr:hypothetical protein HDU86_005877 [Geranomyces michiganensis]